MKKKVHFWMFGYIFGNKTKDDSKLFYFLRFVAFFERDFVKMPECLIFQGVQVFWGQKISSVRSNFQSMLCERYIIFA